MRNLSHMKRTLISILVDAVTTHRTKHRMSRETISDEIVRAHELMNGPDVTGIKFEPKTSDAFDRMKVNADRIHRWLDELTKDNNLIPPNFILSVLAGLPMEKRLKVLNEWMAPVNVIARPIQAEECEFNPLQLLQESLKEGGEAFHALSALVDGDTYQELVAAHKEVSEMAEVLRRTLHALESRMAVIKR